MAHYEQAAFIYGVKQRFPAYFVGTKVLEVGSFNVNGSVRSLFTDPILYIGLDLAPGKDVDVVCHGGAYLTNERFDVVISTEAFEHDAHWEETFDNMIRLCRSGGLVLFTCAANERQEHGTRRTSPADSALATDYYRNLNVIDFENRWVLPRIFSYYWWEARVNDLYFGGFKK